MLDMPDDHITYELVEKSLESNTLGFIDQSLQSMIQHKSLRAFQWAVEVLTNSRSAGASRIHFFLEPYSVVQLQITDLG